MIRKKLVFLGTKPIGYACFEHLLANREALNLEVTGLLTQQRKEFTDGKDLGVLAAAHDIPLIDTPDELPECDIMYSVQYHKILKKEHIAKAREIAVNLHMAPLPEYRGCNQFSFAILDGKKEFGTTLHQIDARIDHGAILFQDRFGIPENCWVDQLYQLSYASSLRLFQEHLKALVDGDYTLTPQETLVAERGTSLHYRNEIQEIKQIDLNWDKEKIERHIRATAMPGFEPPYFIMNGKKIHFAQTD